MNDRPVLRVQMSGGKIYKIWLGRMDITNIVRQVNLSYDSHHRDGVVTLELRTDIEYENYDSKQGNIRFDE
jgi:hypothetical protein